MGSGAGCSGYEDGNVSYYAVRAVRYSVSISIIQRLIPIQRRSSLQIINV